MIALPLLLALAAPVPALPAPRFAVIVGSNTGAPGRPPLWFAEKDAERFRETLLELGEFSPDRVTLLRGGDADRVRQVLAATEARMARARQAGERPLLLFYFSGHAGPGGMELGGDRISFEELRERVSGSSADARVAIVDACEAGLLTQVKGASPAPALSFPLPSDETVRGTAFIASTAVGEAAQESAAIGGSFFTHHLEIALRGAADADGDGRVTLAEAFRYTAARTLAGTAATLGGPQHATYDFKMSGRGDVVLADLRRADARLVLPADPRAGYIIRGPMSMLAEVPGAAAAVTLALPAGRYTIERRSPEGRASTDLELDRGALLRLPPLAPTRYELARAKGGPKPGLLYAGAGIATLGLPGFGAAPAARLGVRKELGPVGLNVGLVYLARSVNDAGFRYDLDLIGGTAAVLYPLNAHRILVEVGPEVGYAYARQRLVDRRTFAAGVLGAGASLLVTAPAGPLRLGLSASVGAQRFRLDERTAVKPAGSLSLLALWGF
ncbi:MAG TPA: caspase family protein [Anaeromyxobacteraceae bacterium]|nr:caspase family protein [Anaeromyxobacteraceae bacterium]